MGHTRFEENQGSSLGLCEAPSDLALFHSTAPKGEANTGASPTQQDERRSWNEMFVIEAHHDAVS